MMLLRKVMTVAVMAGAVCGWARTEGVSLFAADSKGRSAGLIINQAAVSGLRSTAETMALDSVPLITGETANFRLEPMTVFAKDATIEVMTESGTTETLEVPDIRTWYGRDASHPDRALFVSAAADGQVSLMVTGDASTSVTAITRDPAGQPGTYHIQPTRLRPELFCETNDAPPEAQVRAAAANGDTRSAGFSNNITYDIEMMIDIGYRLYTNLDSDKSAVLDYLTNLTGAVNSIYLRDLKTRFTLAHITIWAKQDPFSIPVMGRMETDTQLNRYRDYIYENRGTVHRDIAHFLDGMPFGGRAYIGILGAYAREFRCGVSNVVAQGNFPTNGSYYWDTMVVAHEIGHNVGSPHSHCYNPPIDCCYAECAACTLEKPTTGTIMSYCHLQMYNGGGVSMIFHPRCVDLMRPNIERSPLTAPYAQRTQVEVRGTEGKLIPADAMDTTRSTLLRAEAVGTPVDRIISINNVGELPLSLTGTPAVSLVWPKNATDLSRLLSGSILLSDPRVEYNVLPETDFAVQAQPTTTQLASGAATSFKIRYKAITAGEKYAIVQIATNDPKVPHYRFLIKGRLVKPSAPYTGTFSGMTPIPEGGKAWTKIPVVVEDVPFPIVDVQVLFGGSDCSVASKTGVEHPWVGDLAVWLESPSGTTISLMEYPGTIAPNPPEDPGVPAGSGGKNFCQTLLSDEAGTPAIQDIVTAGAPYSGTYHPAESFAAFRDEDANGTWRVWFYDRAMPDKGVVRDISIIIRGDEATPSSGIPAVTPAENWDLYR